jgi:hypothetical protein
MIVVIVIVIVIIIVVIVMVVVEEIQEPIASFFFHFHFTASHITPSNDFFCFVVACAVFEHIIIFSQRDVLIVDESITLAVLSFVTRGKSRHQQ